MSRARCQRHVEAPDEARTPTVECGAHAVAYVDPDGACWPACSEHALEVQRDHGLDLQDIETGETLWV